MTSINQERDLCRLLYTSGPVSTRPGKPPLDPIEIADHASKRNKAVGITGCLLTIDGQFVQILEGPSKALEETFERICRDFRHTDLSLVDFVHVTERAFPEWGMAKLGIDNETQIELADELEEIRFLIDVNVPEAIGQMRALLDYKSTGIRKKDGPAWNG